MAFAKTDNPKHADVLLITDRRGRKCDDYLGTSVREYGRAEAVVACWCMCMPRRDLEGCGDAVRADQVPLIFGSQGVRRVLADHYRRMLKCFEKPRLLEEPAAVEDPAKDEQEKIEEKPEDVTEEEQDDEE